jgi:hypothetical protein
VKYEKRGRRRKPSRKGGVARTKNSRYAAELAEIDLFRVFLGLSTACSDGYQAAAGWLAAASFMVVASTV